MYGKLYVAGVNSIIDARSFCNLIISFFFCRISSSSLRLSSMGLAVVVVVVVAGMVMMVEGCVCCGATVVRARLSGWM